MTDRPAHDEQNHKMQEEHDREAHDHDEHGGDESPTAEDLGPDQVSGDAPVASRWRGHAKLAGALIAVLVALLGFAIAVQVHSNSTSDSLSNARDDDLIRILDDQNSRAERLREQVAALQTTADQLQASGDRDGVAQQQAEQQAQDLAILLGTVPATGPGVRITITDPKHGLKAEDLLDVVEELRGAGAEAIQFGSVRIGTDSYFQDSSTSVVSVDGQPLSAPYEVLAIGDAQTLQTALEIPGGVAATARAAGGDAEVEQAATVDITATRTVANPRYAKPTGR
ncbi:MAG: DUF881 domain-containing protein [Actinobacteria bacterium]|nr:DUF881 domain-containing protein [Actinomycetota bacterium]